MTRKDSFLFFFLSVLACCNSNDLIPVNFGGFIQIISESNLGMGFKVHKGDSPFDPPFNGQVMDGDVEIGPMTGSTTTSSVITDYARFEETMEISGSLALDLVLIRAEGSGRYLEKYVSTSRKVTFVYRTTHTAFYKRLQPGTLIIGRDAINITDQSEIVEKYGDRFVDTIVYGAHLDVAFTVLSTEDINIKEFEAELKFRIGIGIFSVTFMKKFKKFTGTEKATYEMDIEVKSTGVHLNVPANPTFLEACNIIKEFNNEYEKKVRNFGNNSFLDSFQPVGFMISSTADRINTLDKMQMAAYNSRMNDVAEVLANAIYWRSKIEVVDQDLKYRYERDHKNRVEMYQPYYQKKEKAMQALEDKIDEYKAFRAESISYLISPSTKVPDAYPKIGSAEESILRGLCGEHYIPSPVAIGGRSLLDNNIHYIGFSIEQRGKMIPWMHGSLTRTINGVGTVIASTETPESLYEEYENPTPTMAPTQSCYYPLEDGEDKCPSGNEITTVEQCEQAGLSFGGNLKNSAVITGDWPDTPCGCFIDPRKDVTIHFDRGNKCNGVKPYEYILACNDSSNECAV